MGKIKNEKDILVGKAKEKVGEIFDNQALINEGKTQVDMGEESQKRYDRRVQELDDQVAENESKNQDVTKERSSETLQKKRTETIPEEDHVPASHKREEERLKHYTGIEEKL